MHKRICYNQYNSNSKWVKECAEKNNCDYIIYKRVPMNKFEIKKKSKELYEIKNIGKMANIAQTYLLHIIKNYNNLYDVEIFLDSEMVNLYSKNVSDQIKSSIKYNYKSYSNLDKKLTWTKNEYNSEVNKKMKLINSKFIHKKPNKDWIGWKIYKKLFPNKCKEIECNFPTITTGAYSLFSVRKEQILKHSLHKYKMLYNLFDINKYNSNELKQNYYLLEHTWKLLFTNFPE